MNKVNVDILELLKEIEDLKKENLELKNENRKLAEKLEKCKSSNIHAKAIDAIQRKKTEKIKLYKEKITEIVRENKDINTKELVKRLGINNKTYYNLKLNEFFNNGEGI